MEELSQLEVQWILNLHSYDRQLGYNASFGGDGGGIPTEDPREVTKEKASDVGEDGSRPNLNSG